MKESEVKGLAELHKQYESRAAKQEIVFKKQALVLMRKAAKEAGLSAKDIRTPTSIKPKGKTYCFTCAKCITCRGCIAWT